MEPRGDRVLGLGFDQGNADGALHVSLFDVSDLSNPQMLSRANFGGDWGSLAEDQDRIHKAFNIMEELGLILVPFGGYDYSDESGCGRYVSGVQLIDWANDQVLARGVALQKGQARRAIMHAERMLTVSEDSVQAFDITDRDAPTSMAELPLNMRINRTVRVGDSIARFRTDWWTGSVTLEVVPAATPDAIKEFPYE